MRAGGFRVGQVSTIRSARRRVNGRVRAIAVVDLRLDKSWSPFRWIRASRCVHGRHSGSSTSSWYPDDPVAPSSRATRSRSAPGASTPVDLEDVLSTFQPETRVDARKALQGFGDGLAGRGPALNTTIEELRPFVTRLDIVMRALSDPKTELRGLFPALGRTLRQAAPVAVVQADWVAEMADTFAAVGRNPRPSRRRSRRPRRRWMPPSRRSGCRRRSSCISRTCPAACSPLRRSWAGTAPAQQRPARRSSRLPEHPRALQPARSAVRCG